MKFEKVSINETIAGTKGLNEIRLNKKPLGNIVALVGKNGAGKTRILEFIKEYFEYIEPEHFLNEYIVNLPKELEKQTQGFNNAKTIFESYKKSGKENDYYNAIEIANNILSNFKKEASKYITFVNNEEIIRIKESLPNNISFEDILNDNFTNFDFSAIVNSLSSTPVIDQINAITNKTNIEHLKLHKKHRGVTEKIQKELETMQFYKLFEKFKAYINDYLNADFDYEIIDSDKNETDLVYKSNILNLKILSPGERTLFAYAILFFLKEINSNINIENNIIIIDEPELHLHPKAQIILFEALKNIIGNKGQLWIATHSITILSLLKSNEIFIVKDNEIILPSKENKTIDIHNSVIELFEIGEHIKKVETILRSATEWEYLQFIEECFLQPDVLFNNNSNDPQFKLFNEFIKKTNPMHLLDYGAGKGRIGKLINDDLKLSKEIKYHALEINTNLHELIRKNSNAENIISNVHEINDDTFDCVLLCNVLHEIPPNMWLYVFYGIKRILKQNGRLLIIEDNKIQVGEKANETGYILLNSEQINHLFDASNILNLKSDDKKYLDRITCCAIQKKEINPSYNSIKKELKSIIDSTFKQIKNMRFNTKATKYNGRDYGNLLQLHINSKIALENLIDPNKPEDFLKGKWENMWDDGIGVMGNEIAIINTNLKYSVDNEECFIIKEVKYNTLNNCISFIKEGINNNIGRFLKNELFFVDNNKLSGSETDSLSKKTKITFNKILL